MSALQVGDLKDSFYRATLKHRLFKGCSSRPHPRAFNNSLCRALPPPPSCRHVQAALPLSSLTEDLTLSAFCSIPTPTAFRGMIGFCHFLYLTSNFLLCLTPSRIPVVTPVEQYFWNLLKGSTLRPSLISHPASVPTATFPCLVENSQSSQQLSTVIAQMPFPFFITPFTTHSSPLFLHPSTHKPYRSLPLLSSCGKSPTIHIFLCQHLSCFKCWDSEGKTILFGDWINFIFYVVNSEIYQLRVFSFVPCQVNMVTFYSCCSVFFNNIFIKGLWMVNTLCLWVSGYFVLLSLKKN